MSTTHYTIGELARLSGLSVKRLRFYSDQGLLPPAARTEGGYRVYSDESVARLHLIRALREAGIGLETIRQVLSHRASLSDVLHLRLQALEAEIAARRRIAATLRAALRLPEPTQADLRRLWTVTHLSQDQFRALIERFYERAAEGVEMDPDWKRRMIEAGTPELPDDPSPEQIDAWIELAEMLKDEEYLAQVKADTARMWTGEFDPAAYAEAADRVFARIRSAIDAGAAPTSETGHDIARDWIDSSARAMRRQPDRDFLDWQIGQYRKYHARFARYQDLLAILRGENGGPPSGREWRWITEAIGHHLLGHPAGGAIPPD